MRLQKILYCIIALIFVSTVYCGAGVADADINNLDDLKVFAAIGSGIGTLKSDIGNVAITITTQNPVTLDLAGHTLTGAGIDSAIKIKAGAQLTLENSVGSGKITNSGGKWGSAVLNDGTFIMSSGTIINCRAEHMGGGVYNNGGIFIMSGGTISNCTAGVGGGVSNHGTFEMSDGTISNCTADGSGGGVDNNEGCTFEMSGGTISDCTGQYSSGGVSNSGTFEMSGGTISNCTAYGSGGCMVNGGIFIMSGGTISGCSANGNHIYGGGVYNYGGRPCPVIFTMTGGTIIDCRVTGESSIGGGVCNGAIFNMYGGTIANCSASGKGGNVFNGVGSTFNISPNEVVTDDIYNMGTINQVSASGNVYSDDDGILVSFSDEGYYRGDLSRVSSPAPLLGLIAGALCVVVPLRRKD